MCFLDSVNRSLYNDCFGAISWYFNAFGFLFSIFLHVRCKSEFSVFFLEWCMQYLKAQKWFMLKAATGILDHGVKTRIS